MNSGWTYRDKICAEEAGLTAISFYADRYRHSDEAEWRRRMERGEILRSGALLLPENLLRAGDELEWNRPPWEEPPIPTEIPVLYEDEAVLAVDKPSGLPVLPNGVYLENTLVNLLHDHLGVDGLPPAPAHRLGRGTSGLILLARTQHAREHLCAQFRRTTSGDGGETLRKIYRAITADVPGLSGTVEVRQPIGLVPHARLGGVHAASPNGRPSCSICRVLARRDGRMLWEVEIVTGRPNQIRIHLASIGAPLLGDPFYGPEGLPLPGANALPGDVGYTLRSCYLRFVHPDTGKPVEINAPLTPELM